MNNLPRILFVLAILVVSGAVVTGVSMIDSPGRQRLERLDAARMNILSSMAGAADCVHAATGAYPETLDPLTGPSPAPELAHCTFDTIADPVTGELLDYHRQGDGFELCAVFAADNDTASIAPVSGEVSTAQLQRYRLRGNASHPAGRHCFRFDPFED